MTRLSFKQAIQTLAATSIAFALAGLAMADSTITEPGDLEVRGHAPEPDALMNHYALKNSDPFQVLFIRGVCSSKNFCIGGAGDGMLKEIEFLAPCVVHMLSDRRDRGPYGLAGGRPGEPGKNSFGGQPAPGRFRKEVAPGDRLSVRTPGGGGWGEPV